MFKNNAVWTGQSCRQGQSASIFKNSAVGNVGVEQKSVGIDIQEQCGWLRGLEDEVDLFS